MLLCETLITRGKLFVNKGIIHVKINHKNKSFVFFNKICLRST